MDSDECFSLPPIPPPRNNRPIPAPRRSLVKTPIPNEPSVDPEITVFVEPTAPDVDPEVDEVNSDSGNRDSEADEESGSGSVVSNR